MEQETAEVARSSPESPLETSRRQLTRTVTTALSSRSNVNVKNDQLRHCARMGNAHAQMEYGMRLLYGINIELDRYEAMRCIKDAAYQGLSSAQFALGLLYHRGQGVEQDWIQAKEWFRKAGDGGLPVAVYMYACAAKVIPNTSAGSVDVSAHFLRAATLLRCQALLGITAQVDSSAGLRL